MRNRRRRRRREERRKKEGKQANKTMKVRLQESGFLKLKPKTG